VSVWNKLYKSKLWKTVRFSEGHVFQDVEVTYKIIALCDSISVIDNVLYTHRDRPNSITTSFSLKNYKDWILACSREEFFIRSNVPNLFSEEQFKAIREFRITEMISIYIRCSYKDSDWQNFREELRISIIETCTELRLKKIRTRVACLIIQFCPWMLKHLYSLYLARRRLDNMK